MRRWPSEKMDKVAFLLKIPPLQELDFDPDVEQRLPRLDDLNAKTPMREKKRVGMIEKNIHGLPRRKKTTPGIAAAPVLAPA